MADHDYPQYPPLLAGYKNAAPLSDDKADDGGLKNVQSGVLSESYQKFADPLDNSSRGAFDVHIYYMPINAEQARYARALHERIRREFPELRIYEIVDRPVGPHPVPMFEVNLCSPAEFGAFVPWLVIHRGPLSALVHPNTTKKEVVDDWAETNRRNHVDRAMWLGERFPVDWELFGKMTLSPADISQLKKEAPAH